MPAPASRDRLIGHGIEEAMMSQAAFGPASGDIEYAAVRRSPYPPHWGPPPADEARRIRWAAEWIQQDIAGRNTRRLAWLHRRRYDPYEHTGAV
jgi:hypothetical protein